MTHVIWEDPPEPPVTPLRAPRRQTKWEGIGELLRRRPGVWAIVETFNDPNYGTDRDKARAGATARNLCHGLYNGCAEVEAVARQVGEEWRVYARYVGGAP